MYIENIIERYGTAVYSFALLRLKNPDDAADVYQNVFLKLFEKKQIGVMDWNCLTKDSEGNYTIEQLFKNFKSRLIK